MDDTQTPQQPGQTIVDSKTLVKGLGTVTQAVTIAAILGGAAWATSIHTTVGDIKAELSESNTIHRLTIEHHGTNLTAHTAAVNQRLDRIERILDQIVKPVYGSNP